VIVRAVIFDGGGVLEKVDEDGVWLSRWQSRLHLSEAEFTAALDRVDPEGLIAVGGLTEEEFRRRYAEALGLNGTQTEEFMQDMWDWYCGELDEVMVRFVSSLRPKYTTAIVTNSADGARREEQSRYRLGDLVDTIIYSHEVGIAKPDPGILTRTCERLRVDATECVLLDDTPEVIDAARQLGMRAVLHRDTETSIAEVAALLRE
jgi:epoxide hydrolase-like predicted phosphatase